MNIDVSFGWQQNDGIKDSNAGKDALTQAQCDDDITRPVAILKSVVDTSTGAAKGKAVDPYDNEYWIKLPLL